MAKLVYTALASLDGYHADAEGTFDWAVPDEEVHAFINDLERGVGTYLYGRRMYQTMSVWETDADLAAQADVMRDFAEIWQAADKIVYSKTLETVSTERTRLERDFDPEAVRQMKASAGSDLAVAGPELAAHAFRAGLVKVHRQNALAAPGDRVDADPGRDRVEPAEERAAAVEARQPAPRPQERLLQRVLGVVKRAEAPGTHRSRANSRHAGAHVVKAVVFDMDGVLVDTERDWDAARREVADALGGEWRPEATRDMMGMSAPEWSRYMHDRLGVQADPEEINRRVVAAVLERVSSAPPMLPGAKAAVETLAAHWPLGVASSANRPVIETVLEAAGLAPFFQAIVSSEEVPRGKPAPDVYLAAAGALGVDPHDAAAIEDSSSGIRSAASAGMLVVALPNAHFPPDEEALAEADYVIGSLEELEALRESWLGRGHS
jgi:HAD superfamily hydrolase (TIGR01509 family)